MNRFLCENNDGIVIDLSSNLMWFQNLNMFCETTWENAVKVCETINVVAKYDKEKDRCWRLPTIKDLITLVDYSCYNFALQKGHPFIFNNTNDCQHSCNYQYWSSTEFSNDKRYVFMINLQDGCIVKVPKVRSYNILLVR